MFSGASNGEEIELLVALLRYVYTTLGVTRPSAYPLIASLPPLYTANALLPFLTVTSRPTPLIRIYLH